MNKKNILKNNVTVIALLIANTFFAQESPTFNEGQNPIPSSKKWKLVKNMSDEFNGKKLDENKWRNSTGGWIGRPPGLFVPNTVKVKDGSLQITNYKLPKTIIHKSGKKFTHAGGLVASNAGLTYGYYECKMKASKTFMSSTFWLINDRKELEGCDKRVVELDIQECIGQVTSTKKFAQNSDSTMGSNTHSRGIPEDCSFPKGSNSFKTEIKGNAKVYDDFHIYGVWWKSKDEVQFFLDGIFQEKVTPPADFDIPMHLRMVTETYDWNPVPADGGMTGSKEDRTTTYDWVRTWKLSKNKKKKKKKGKRNSI